MRRLKDDELSFDYIELKVHRTLICETAYVIKHGTTVVQKPELLLQFWLKLGQVNCYFGAKVYHLFKLSS